MDASQVLALVLLEDLFSGLATVNSYTTKVLAKALIAETLRCLGSLLSVVLSKGSSSPTLGTKLHCTRQLSCMPTTYIQCTSTTSFRSQVW